MYKKNETFQSIWDFKTQSYFDSRHNAELHDKENSKDGAFLIHQINQSSDTTRHNMSVIHSSEYLVEWKFQFNSQLSDSLTACIIIQIKYCSDDSEVFDVRINTVIPYHINTQQNCIIVYRQACHFFLVSKQMSFNTHTFASFLNILFETTIVNSIHSMLD